MYRTVFPQILCIKKKRNLLTKRRTILTRLAFGLLLQMRDCLVERIDHATIDNVAIFVCPCEKLTPDWKEEIPYIFRYPSQLHQVIGQTTLKPHSQLVTFNIYYGLWVASVNGLLMGWLTRSRKTPQDKHVTSAKLRCAKLRTRIITFVNKSQLFLTPEK